jgi:2-alkenal reductase
LACIPAARFDRHQTQAARISAHDLHVTMVTSGGRGIVGRGRHEEPQVRDRIVRIVLTVIGFVLVVVAAHLHVERLLFSGLRADDDHGQPGLSARERATIALFGRAAPAVVEVTSITDRAIRTGSGFVWDAAGHIVTNQHVTQDARTIAVWFAAGEPIEAELVGAALNHDLAVLRLKGTSALPPPLAIGSSADLAVGQFVYAIGSPFSLDQSLTTGVISALKRRLPTQKGREITNIIQTDAATYPGNSGGPLLDSSGRLIGVNTLSYRVAGTSAGLGFAIPVDLVKRIVPELIANGRVPTPGIGIVPLEQPEGAAIEGVTIARVRPGTPAERAGLRGRTDASRGDVITEVNGVRLRSVFDFTGRLEQTGIGGKALVTIRRDDETLAMELDIVDIDRVP